MNSPQEEEDDVRKRITLSMDEDKEKKNSSIKLQFF